MMMLIIREYPCLFDDAPIIRWLSRLDDFLLGIVWALQIEDMPIVAGYPFNGKYPRPWPGKKIRRCLV